jgi:excisionase family DNA binding protein
MPDEILTLPEVAQLLKVADKTVYTMAQKGELPAFKVRGQWRFRRQDLDSWMAAQVASAATPEQPVRMNALQRRHPPRGAGK